MTAPTPHASGIPADRRTPRRPARRAVVVGTGGLGPGELTAIGLACSPIGPADVLWAPDRTDPLVADTAVDAIGVGPLAGLQVRLRDVRPLPPVGEPVLVVGDDVVACVMHTATDHVVLVGSDTAFSAEAADHPGTAAFAAWAQGGHLSARTPPPTKRQTRRHVAPPRISTARSDWAQLEPPVGVAVADPAFTRAAAHAGRLLPAAVHDALIDFADDSGRSGALVVGGVPIGEVGPTPPRPAAQADKDRRGDRRSEFALLCVARRLGQPVGYLPEHGGDLIQQIVPTPGGADLQISTSSQVTLEFHTEAAFHRHRPRFLVLLCLRGDPAAHTLLASVHELVDELDPAVRAILREPRFRTCADRSYVGQRPTRLSAPLPILSGPAGAPHLVFDADLMVGTDPDADAALCALRDATQRCHTAVALDAGDLLVVDNTVAVHGRSPFTPRFDGTDRWLQRSFVVADLAASAGERNDRVITTRYAP